MMTDSKTLWIKYQYFKQTSTSKEKKDASGNQMSFLSKELSEEIMTRLRLHNN